MAILGIVIGVLALLATAWGVYYSRGQLREAEKVREENQRFAKQQREEDDTWAEKYVRAGKLLCRIADADRFAIFPAKAARVMYLGGSLGMLFGEDVRKQILGQLIEEQNGNNYALRPIDVPRLRLKATRDLIDLVLATLGRFQKEKPSEAKELGL